jgi:hypothetical protein
MSGPEPWGRWNDRKTVVMTISADAQRAPIYRDAFFNLQIAPYRLPGQAARRLVLSWGAGRNADTSLENLEWLSLPLQPGDWTGGPWLYALEVSISLPDAVPLRGADPRSDDPRPIAVSFQGLSFSARPLGRVITPAVGPAR